MTTANHQTVETLKSEGHYFAAGALAAALGNTDLYGCHFGMRSDLDRARAQFHRGYNAAKAAERG